MLTQTTKNEEWICKEKSVSELSDFVSYHHHRHHNHHYYHSVVAAASLLVSVS